MVHRWRCTGLWYCLGVAHTSVRPAEATEFCLFCGVAIALARMRNHVAVHLQKGEVVTDPRRGEAIRK